MRHKFEIVLSDIIHCFHLEGSVYEQKLRQAYRELPPAIETSQDSLVFEYLVRCLVEDPASGIRKHYADETDATEWSVYLLSKKQHFWAVFDSKSLFLLYTGYLDSSTPETIAESFRKAEQQCLN